MEYLILGLHHHSLCSSAWSIRNIVTHTDVVPATPRETRSPVTTTCDNQLESSHRWVTDDARKCPFGDENEWFSFGPHGGLTMEGPELCICSLPWRDMWVFSDNSCINIQARESGDNAMIWGDVDACAPWSDTPPWAPCIHELEMFSMFWW
jgi:hypothetical protein